MRVSGVVEVNWSGSGLVVVSESEGAATGELGGAKANETESASIRPAT